MSNFLEEMKQKQKEKEQAERERRREDREADAAERERRRENIERRSLIGAVVSAAAALLAGGLTFLQVHYSRRDSEQAQRNFEITRKDAAESAAQARNDALDAINRQLEASKELKEQAQRSANAAESSVASRRSLFTFPSAHTSTSRQFFAALSLQASRRWSR